MARRRRSSTTARARAALVLLGWAGVSMGACTLIEDNGVGRPGNFGTQPPAPTRAGGRGRTPPSTPHREPPAPPAPLPDPGAGADSIHLAMGVPVDADPSDDFLIVRPQYALSYNKIRNEPNWVSWNLDEAWMGKTPRRKGKFITDVSLPPGFFRVEDRDYAGSGYDRGHMTRSEDRSRSPEDMAATFLLTNIVPQTHALNAGPWLRLEDYSEALAKRENKELFIVSGGLFRKSSKTIGRGIAVPDSCFKVVVILDRGQGARDVTESTRVIAVIMPNDEGMLDDPWGPLRVSVDEVEKQSGYHFLSAVAEPLRRTLSSRVDRGPTRL